MRSGAVEARRPHKSKDVGANPTSRNYWDVAQLAERRTLNPNCIGSNPVISAYERFGLIDGGPELSFYSQIAQ